MDKNVIVRECAAIRIFPEGNEPRDIESVLIARVTVPDWILMDKNEDRQVEKFAGWMGDKSSKGLIEWEGLSLREITEALGYGYDTDLGVKDLFFTMEIVGGPTLYECWS